MSALLAASKRESVFLEAAERIGSRLCRDAVHFDNRCTWIGSSMEFIGTSWAVVERAFGAELYSGTSGIALILARLYDLTGETVYRDIAKLAVAQSRKQAENLRKSGFGFYAGMTGLAYAWTEIGEAFGDGELLEAARTLLKQIMTCDIETQGLDVVSGCAGVIPVFLDLAHRLDEPALRDFAIRCGEHVLSSAKQRTAGMSWRTLEMPAVDDLTGFSHGTSGVAWALLELYTATGDERFRRAAEAGFAYERAWYSAEQENWPDLRVLDGQPITPERQLGYALAWCHGAPGIGLSRLRAHALTGDRIYREEVAAAINATRRSLSAQAQGTNYSLCHGLFGNADLLIEAARAFGDPTLELEAQALGAHALERHHCDDEPWPCGVPNGTEAPGLLLGLAGIAYFYLRLYDAHKYPSLLLVAPRTQR